MKYQYSYSKISMYKQCPLRFKFKYVDGLPTKTNEAMLVGGCFHEFVAKYSKRHGADFFFDDYSNDLHIFLEKSLEKSGFDTETKSVMIENVFEKTRNLWKNYEHKFRENWDDSTKKQFELQYAIDMKGNSVNWTDSSVFFRAIFDRVETFGNDDIHIIDYKTGRGENDPLQLEIYFWMIKKAGFENHVTCIFENVVDCTCEVKIFINSDFDTIEDKIFDIVDTMENDTEFKPCENSFCEWCDFVGRCPAMEKTITTIKNIELVDIATVGQAIRAIEFLNKVDQVRKIAKSKIDYFWKTNLEHNIQLENGFYGREDKTKFKIKNADIFYETCIKNQVDPMYLLNGLNKARLKQKNMEIMKNDLITKGAIEEVLDVGDLEFHKR